MRKTLVIITASFWSLLIFGISAYADPFSKCQEYVRYGAPSKQGDLLCHKAFAIAHNPDRKTPDWVAEHLTKKKVSAVKIPRTKFQADPELAEGKRAETSDYLDSRYDQGHMAPAADMYWSKQAMKESHYLSNVVPQVGVGMNRHIWADLELAVRQWTRKRGELFVFTGPIYKDAYKAIGKNKVAVPTHLYKVIFDPKRIEAIAFIMPNKKLNREDIPNYIVSIAEVEAETDLNFLSNLSADVEKRVESERADKVWEGCGDKLPKSLENLLCQGD